MRMMNILLNKTDFDQDWASPYLMDLFRQEDRVCVLPLSLDEGWASDHEDWQDRFQSGSEYREDINRPLLNYGIRLDRITYCDHFVDSKESVLKKIQEASILVLLADNAREAMLRLEELPAVMDAILRFHGIVITLAEANHLFLDEFYDRTYGEYYVGLGVLPGIAFMMDYNERLEELRETIFAIESLGKRVVLLPQQSGMLFDGEHYELFGNSRVVDEEDLDELYLRYQFEQE